MTKILIKLINDMATQSYEQLISGANKIRKNELPESNTAGLVGEQLLQMVNKQQEEHRQRVKGTTEYNVSVQNPTSGIDGSNKYGLKGAIAQVPQELRNIGLKVSFVNSDGTVEMWEYQGGTYTNLDNWKSNEGKLASIRDEAIDKIKDAESDAISNFSSQRVTPEMLSESTKQFINASGGGTINNLADDEDLVSVDKGENLSVLKFADRAYNPGIHVGMGYKILRRNIIDGKNILTQDMINQSYTIYVVQYDYDLNGATITLPEGCMFDFQGGSISNGFLEGKIENTHARPEWFHSPKDEDWSAAIQQALNICPTVLLSNKIYELRVPILLNIYNHLIGIGTEKSKIISNIDSGFCIYCNIDDNDKDIQSWYSFMVIKDLAISYKHKDWVDDERLTYYENAHCIKSSANLHVINVNINYFNKAIEFPNYADSVKLHYLTIDDRARLKKTDYAPNRDCNIIFKESGDCADICFLYNSQVYFNLQPSILVRNCIQCGFVFKYSNAKLVNVHNEDTEHYPIFLSESNVVLDNCFFHVPESLEKSVIYKDSGFNNLSSLTLVRTSFNGNPTNKGKVYYHNNIIDFNHTGLSVYVNNSYRAILGASWQNIHARIADTVLSMPSESSKIVNAKLQHSWMFTDRNPIYLYGEGVSSVPRKFEGADLNNNLKIGKYVYEVTPVLDRQRLIVFNRIKNSSYRCYRTEEDLDNILRLVIYAAVPTNLGIYIHRIYNDADKKKCYVDNIVSLQTILLDDGDTIVGNYTEWEDDNDEMLFNVIEDENVYYKNDGLNVVVKLKDIPKVGKWEYGDKVIVSNVEHMFNGSEWL